MGKQHIRIGECYKGLVPVKCIDNPVTWTAVQYGALILLLLIHCLLLLPLFVGVLCLVLFLLCNT